MQPKTYLVLPIDKEEDMTPLSHGVSFCTRTTMNHIEPVTVPCSTSRGQVRQAINITQLYGNMEHSTIVEGPSVNNLTGATMHLESRQLE